MLTSNQFIKGMNQDVDPRLQPESTYRFGLNGVLETSSGEWGKISNESGTATHSTIQFPNKKLIGSVYTENEKAILFFYAADGNHEIGEYSTNTGSYTTLIINPCLNFKEEYPVNAIYSVNNGADGWVNFTDQYNDYRALNLSNISAYTETIACDLLKYSKDYTVPTVRVDQLTRYGSGGNVGLGVYNISVRYIDSNGTPTKWILNSKPIAVGSASEVNLNNTYSYNLYSGGSNITDSDYYKSTEKSLKIRLENVDYTRFKFIQFAFTHRGADSGAVSSVKVTKKIPISDYFVEYVYTAFDDVIERDSSVEELVSENQRFDVVAAHSIDNNRLYLGGIKNDTVDYSSFQRAASATKIQWVKTRDPIMQNTSKSDTYYFDEGSFLDDEIYALGVVFQLADGSESPQFHIPGRPADISVTGSNPQIGTGGIATDTLAWDRGATVNYGNYLPSNWTQRWQAVSTATYIAQNPSTAWGLMGYYETSTYYPAVQSCDNHPDGYWGRDWTGRLITTADKIRHHRMPNRCLRPVTSPDKIERVGIKVTNLTYPPGVVGHRIVYGDRTNQRTILDKGILIPLTASTGNALTIEPSSITPTPFAWSALPGNTLNLKMFAFLSARQQFTNLTVAPDYLTVETLLEDETFTSSVGPNFSTTSSTINGDTINWETELFNLDKPNCPSNFFNYQVNSATKITKASPGQLTTNAQTIGVDGTTIVNNSLSLDYLVLNLSSVLSEVVTNGTTPDDRVYYVSLRANRDVFSALDSIQYKQVNSAPYYSTAEVDMFGGDSFIGPVNITDYSFDFPSLTSGTMKGYHISYMSNEDRVNPAFRSNGNTAKTSTFVWNFTNNHYPMQVYLRSKIYELNSTDRTAYPEEYHYNNSYSFIGSLETYYPHINNNTTGYTWCSTNTNYFPSRVFYSNAQSAESFANEQFTVGVNNYQDLPLESGPITDLFTNYNNLYASTSRTTYKIPTREQTIVTEDATAFLGSGKIFAIPPQALNSTDIAFSGAQSWTTRASTEYGQVYVDPTSGKVFLLTDQLNDLTKDGLRNFWQENGALNLDKQFRTASGNPYPFSNFSGSISIGYRSVYDYRHKRILITKKDYSIRSAYLSNFVVGAPAAVEGLYFYNGVFTYVDSLGNVSNPTFENSTVFENKSFTLSYSLAHNAWVSFHSYIPHWSFAADQKYFLYNGSNSLSIGNRGPFQTYFGIKYDHILDLVVPSKELAAATHNIFYTATSRLRSSTEEEFVLVDDTYDNVIVYNTSQSSGKLSLIPLGVNDVSSTPGTASVTKKDREYRIAEFRDYTKDNKLAIWNSSWDGIKTFPFAYIDKVVNQSNIDFTKDLYSLPRFRDLYCGIRLFFKPAANIKISLDNVMTKTQKRLR